MPARRPVPTTARVARAAALVLGVLGLGVAGCGDEAGEPRGGAPEVGGSATMPYSTPPSGAGSAGAHGKGPPAFRFEDVTKGSGIENRNHSGRPGVKEYLVEAVGVGPAWLDYDGDGRLDLYVPDGDVLTRYALTKEPDPAAPKATRPRLVVRPEGDGGKALERFRDRLYRNLGGGRFEDVTEKAGLGDEAWSFGALAWDYDADGRTDLFVANFGPNRLYHNEGDGTFEDVAAKVGLAGDPAQWCTCATCGDYDGDGRLDLYVARYADVAAEVERQRVQRGLPEGTPIDQIPGRACNFRGVPAYCGPVGLVGQHDSLYRQREDGTFADVAVEVGMRPKAAKYGFTSTFFDYDGDGLLDVYVANDSEENFLWHQVRRDGRPWFEDVADPLGVKFGPNQNPQASMGLAIADVNQDGRLDVFVTNFSHDYNNLFVGFKYPGGSWTFKDRGLQVMGQDVFYDLAWGCGWYDFDLDADLDLLVANGHVYDEIDLFGKTGTSYRQWPAIFECLSAKDLAYREVGPKATPPEGVAREDLFAGHAFDVKRCSRGAAFADFDDDGDVDVFVQNMNDDAVLVRNELPPSPARGWLRLSLRQDGGNREGVGAIVQVKADGITQTFPVVRGQSFLGTDDPRIPVGLGAAKEATVLVTWPGPDRAPQAFEHLARDAAYVLRRDGKVEKAAK